MSIIEVQLVLSEKATAEQAQRQIESLEAIDDCWLIVDEINETSDPYHRKARLDSMIGMSSNGHDLLGGGV